MRICIECGREQVDDLGRCIQCGGELRKRTISEAVIELADELRKENACPRCGTSVPLRGREGVCVSCGAFITKIDDSEGKLALTRP